ncbi:MAG: hypothetical protein ACTHX1_10895 [Micrococcaceae bacterium]
MSQTVDQSIWTRTLSRLTVNERANWAVESELLAHGVSTMRLPRSTVVGVRGGEPVSELGFIGLQGPGSTLTGSSFIQHARTVREMLDVHHLPVASGIRCTSKQLRRATRHAASVGYPVLVRPANSPQTNKLRRIVSSDDEMKEALALIQRKTNGRYQDKENTVSTAWIQEIPEGQFVRFLVVGTDVIAAVIGELASDESTRPLRVEDLHPGIRTQAVAALRSIPGVEHGEVLMMVQDLRKDAIESNTAIMMLSASPELDMYEHSLGGGVTRQIVRHYLTRAGVSYSEPLRDVTTSTTFTGVVEPERFMRRLNGRISKLLGADAGHAVRDLSDGQIELRFSGDSPRE